MMKFAASKLMFALAGLGVVAMPVMAEGFPSSKTAVSINELIALSQVADGDNQAGDTGWTNILSTRIKTSSQKDLIFDVSLQCGIVTDTTVSSRNGSFSTSTARANIAVRVLVDGVPAEPDNSIDATKETAEGVVFCDRGQTLAAKFAGLDCTADLITGVVTCASDESLQLILKTLNANAFNFAATDVGSGVHDVVVQARAKASVNFLDDGPGGTMAGAEAFTGAGAVIVEEVRLVKGADIVIDMP